MTLDEARAHLASGRLVEGRRAGEAVRKQAPDAATELEAIELLTRAHLFQNATLDAARAVGMGRARARKAADAAAELRIRLLGCEVSLAGETSPHQELASLDGLVDEARRPLLAALHAMSHAIAGEHHDEALRDAERLVLSPPEVALPGLAWLASAHLRLGAPADAVPFAHAGVAMARALGHEAWRAHLDRIARRAHGQADPAAQKAVVQLVGLASDTAGLRDTAPLLRQVCRATLELLEVDRAFVALRHNGGSLRVVAALARPGVVSGQPSRHILQQVVRTGRELVSNDLEGETQARSASIIAMGLRSVICAPLTEGDQVIGVIYGDSERVTEHELKQVAWLARGLAGVAAVSLGNARRLDRAEQRSQQGRELAHDVRNQLNMLRLAAEDIEEDPDVPGWARSLSQRSAKVARSMQEQLRRLLAPAEEVVRRSVELGALSAELVAVCEREARDAGVRIEQSSASITVRADPDELGRALTNLLTNAVKYAPRGSAVSVSVSARGVWAVWSVRDRGPGIPADELEQIFASGHQARGARQGFGLGLGIAQRIVTAHGGQVRAENDPDGGARFEVLLPRV